MLPWIIRILNSKVIFLYPTRFPRSSSISTKRNKFSLLNSQKHLSVYSFSQSFATPGATMPYSGAAHQLAVASMTTALRLGANFPFFVHHIITFLQFAYTIHVPFIFLVKVYYYT